MHEVDRIRFEDILESIELLQSWMGEYRDEASFLSSTIAKDAAAMRLMVIGETARRLSEDAKSLAPEIPWQSVIGLRNRIAHGYETVDHHYVWLIIEEELPVLKTTLAKLLET